jgi:hypothetical protein
MTDTDETGAARVRLLARYAALPLPPQREALVAAILDAWVPAANELSRKMSAPEHQSLLPVTVLTHPGEGEEPT